jgi:ribosomal protein L10
MTRDQFREFAQEALGTIDSMEEIVDSMKGGLTALRVQVADAVEAVDDHREACIGECARELAAQLRQGGRIISLKPDNLSPAWRR